jgi:hypothetical protein
MSHFAQINQDNTVVQVIVAEPDMINTGLFGDPAQWIQTSYRTRGGQHPEGTPLRKNFAGIGYTYDPTRDAFIPPCPYASWVLNEDTCLWDAPIPKPQDDDYYVWSEDLQQWLKV